MCEVTERRDEGNGERIGEKNNESVESNLTVIINSLDSKLMSYLTSRPSMQTSRSRSINLSTQGTIPLPLSHNKMVKNNNQ